MTARGGGSRVEGLARAVVVLGVLLLVAIACSRSGFDFVENEDEGVFVKFPDEWAVFETTEIDPPAVLVADLLLQPVGEQAEPWQVIIDAGPDATASHIREPLYGYPVGLAEVQPIEPAIRDLFNTSTMRQLATNFEFDPARPPETVTGVSVLLDVDVARDDFRGNRVVFSQPVEDGIRIVDNLVLVDDLNTRWYRLTLSCEENCYRANAELIDEIVSSFTVEG